MAYTKYSLTPANNNAAPPDGAPEGMLPSAVNDTMRDMMSQIRDCGDGIRGGTYTMTAPVITGGSVSGITDLAIADGGTGASTAANARTNLGVTATGADTTYAYRANNLSDLASASTARTNLGLGTAATSSTGDFLPSVNPSYTGTLTGGTGVVNLGSGQFYKDASGNVGIGTSSPSSKFAVNGSAFVVGRTIPTSGAGTELYWTGTQSGIASYDRTNSAWKPLNLEAEYITLNTNAAERMRIDSAGNVGIGTSSPAAKLDVRKTSFTPTTYATPALIVEDATTWSQSTQYYLNNAGTFFSGKPSGAIGAANNSGLIITGGAVITDNPDSSNGYTASTTGAAVYRINNFLGAHVWYTNSGLTAGNTFTATERMRIDSSGNLLVGTTTAHGKVYVESASTSVIPLRGYVNVATSLSTPALRLDKYDNDQTTSQVFAVFSANQNNAGCGQINSNGSNQAAFGSFSDSRLKENIIDLPSQLGNITALRPVEFDYIESEGGGHQLGFIAQEMQKVYPDAIGERDDGMLTISGWSKTEARLVKAIQEQQAMIESLTTRLNALEAK